ncbi:MAG: DMT family transporter [Calditrichaeota bacterium]|nr:DMT family transporter [Calditrichota bacterium]
MNYWGEIAALGTAICWSFSAVFFTIASRRVGALTINLFRLPLAIFLLLTTYLLSGGNFQIQTDALLYLALSGVLGLAIGDTFLFYSMVLVGSRIAMLLLSLSPPITALLAFLMLGETLSLKEILGIGLTIFGVSWVVLEKNDAPHARRQDFLKGVMLGFLSAFTQSLNLIFAKKGLVMDVDALFGTLIRMVSAALILWPASFLLRKIKNPIKMLKADLTAVKYLLSGVTMGPYLGVWLSLVAVKFTHTGIAATLMSIVPVTMIPISIRFEKERPTVRSVLGAVVTVIGIAFLFL